MKFVKMLKTRLGKYILSRSARRHGFLDPIEIMARLEKFAQPAEIREPIELLRAGVVFHARGLMNSKVIQHNLDWVWPYWVQRQFDPHDVAFIPRAFSITHVNLTHRNWTAVGLPNYPEMPIIDPRGLITPFFDGWSIDCWVVAEDGASLLPATLHLVDQQLRQHQESLAVVTKSQINNINLTVTTAVVMEDDLPVCRITADAASAAPAWVVIALRPFNPEGVSFIHKIACVANSCAWQIDDNWMINFKDQPERHLMSTYQQGDVFINMLQRSPSNAINCDIGMASAAALYSLEKNNPRQIEITIPLQGHRDTHTQLNLTLSSVSWKQALTGVCHFQSHDPHLDFLFETAIQTLILLSPDDVYPGPYTYKRFWFRDACLMAQALLAGGLIERTQSLIERFSPRQTPTGYFHSQDGEWDSNGQVLWLLEKFAGITRQPWSDAWENRIILAADWIVKKRLPDHGKGIHAGLLPAGFSAEHLGNNDYYYWDNYWSVAGLRAASRMFSASDERLSHYYHDEASKLMAAIERSLIESLPVRQFEGISASPYRRMDSGAIGSLSASYPTQMVEEKNPRILATAEYLLTHCRVNNGFFLDITHSGINPYLSLHLAQVLLRAGDERFLDLVTTIAALASPTGQWPEAIHPGTGGGCMGDGQHGWAAAEWVMMIRNMFVREEGDRLILASGIAEDWLKPMRQLSLGPTPTHFGRITVMIQPGETSVIISWVWQECHGHPIIEIRLPGKPIMEIPDESVREVEL